MLPGFDLTQKVISSGFHTSRVIEKALLEILLNAKLKSVGFMGEDEHLD